MQLGWSRTAVAGALLAACVAAWAAPARAAEEAPGREAAAAELARLAPRIEALKRDVAAGRGDRAELTRLLARSQELAAVIDGGRPPPGAAPAGADAQELREHADALRDRADRTAALLAEVERRLAAARKRERLGRELDAVGVQGELFAGGTALRTGTPAASGNASTGNSGNDPGSGGPGPGTGGGTSGLAGAGTPFAAAPPSASDAADPLAPLPSDDAARLRRKQAELAAALAGLRAQADALDAEARAAENAR